jgi:menaquinone-dependent protoporphyrinogen IX oxidase
MKGLVIYKGRYGSTKQYAMWIGQQLELSVASTDHFPPDELSKYDYFIIGSSVYIGKLEIRNWLKRKFRVLQNKKIFLFQVAGAPVEDKEKREGFNKASVPQAILSNAECYYFPGRMIIRNLSAFDRFMLKMGARLTKDPVEKENMLTEFDNVKKENIEPLVKAVKNYQKINEPAVLHA